MNGPQTTSRRSSRGKLDACRYHGRTMIHPRIDELLDKVDSRYALVIVAAKRARQINNYHHQLGEGTFDEFAPPLIESRSKNYLTMSLEEIAEGKIVYEYPKTAKQSGTTSGMSRILLGVTGGIAAYKACELTRLLVKAGPRRDPARHARRAALRDRGDLPRARPPSDERGRLPAPDARRPARRRAVHGEHAGEARARDRRQRPHRGGARAPRAGARRAGDEPAHVGASGDARERRDARARAASSSSGRTRARWPRASGASAGSPSPMEIAARVEQLLAPGSLAGRRVLDHRRRDARAGRQRPLRRQPLVGAHGRRARRGGAPPRGRGDPARRESLCRAPYGVETIPTPTAEAMLDAALALPDVDVAAARGGGRRLPARRGAQRQARRRTSAAGRSSSSRPTTSRSALGERKRAGQVLVAFGAEHGAEGLARKRAMLETKNADLVVFNDVGRADIGFDSADNEVVLIARDGERTVPKASKAAIAAAILDEVEGLLHRRRRDGRGRGTRLRPITEHWPKPVLPIDGKPVVVTLVHELAAAGCERIVVVTGHLAEQVEALLEPLPYEIRFVRQPPGQGSADAVLRARATPPYLVLAADNVFAEGDLARFARRAPALDGAVRGPRRRAAAALAARRARPAFPRSASRAKRRTSCCTSSGTPSTPARRCLLSRSGATRDLTTPSTWCARTSRTYIAVGLTEATKKRERRVRPLPRRPEAAPQGDDGAGDRAAREGEEARAGEGVDPRGARHRVLPSRALAGGGGASSARSSKSSSRPTTTRTTRSAGRSRSRAAGRGERPLQARELDEARLRDLRGAHQGSRRLAVRRAGRR